MLCSDSTLNKTNQKIGIKLATNSEVMTFQKRLMLLSICVVAKRSIANTFQREEALIKFGGKFCVGKIYQECHYHSCYLPIFENYYFQSYNHILNKK